MKRDAACGELEGLMAVAGGYPELIKRLEAKLAEINHRISDIEKKVRGLDA